MKAIIMGCGRAGEQVARLMAAEGHQVTMIDSDPEALARLSVNFNGQTIQGVGFDREILELAGIKQAGAFAATSRSDNQNIIAARIARNIYHVPQVVCRLYDLRRAEIYRRLGLLTISSTTWGAERIHELLLHNEFDPVYSFGHGEVSLLSIDVPSHLIGRMVKDLSISGEIQVISITRNDHAFIPLTGTEFKARDTLHLAVRADAMDRAESLLGLEGR
jgi:trk system potassium uptake protein